MGRRKRNNIDFPRYQVKPETVAKLQSLALEMGYKHGDTAAMGAFLDMLADLDRDLLKIIAEKSRKIAIGQSRIDTVML
jgi:hypothetical protein